MTNNKKKTTIIATRETIAINRLGHCKHLLKRRYWLYEQVAQSVPWYPSLQVELIPPLQDPGWGHF